LILPAPKTPRRKYKNDELLSNLVYYVSPERGNQSMAEPNTIPIQVPWDAFGVIAVAGIAGGIVNCLLSEDGFSLPYFAKNKEG